MRDQLMEVANLREVGAARAQKRIPPGSASPASVRTRNGLESAHANFVSGAWAEIIRSLWTGGNVPHRARKPLRCFRIASLSDRGRDRHQQSRRKNQGG